MTGLRISSRDRRVYRAGGVVGLIDRDGALVSVHRSSGAAMRALVTLTSAASEAPGVAASDVYDAAVDAAKRLFPGRGFDALYGGDQVKLIAEIRRLLRGRR
jgi:hypothetical protein